MHAARPDETAGSIEAVINYVDPTAPIGGINDVEREKSTFSLIAHPMRIQNARALQAELGLERTGFVWLRRPSAVSDFGDPEVVEQVYLPECAALVQELTGADKVVAFGKVERDGGLERSQHRPVFNAHVDYNIDTVRRIAAQLLPPEDMEARREQRIALINVWRPLEPVECHPLAVCDASSVVRGDLVFGPIAKSASGVADAAGWNLAHNPGHRWHYVPAMQPDEVLVFKHCDTDESRVQWSAHTAIEDPLGPANPRPRRSIELRTLAFFS